MVKKRNNVRHRRLAIESLEKREVLTAYINELMVDPLFESGDNRQYVELRGDANTRLDAGTYLLVISDRGITGTTMDPGTIHGIFDLSGQPFGSNGILLILPQASLYPLGKGLATSDKSPTILRSTEAGFGGLPGDIYSDIHPLSETIDFILGSNSYFLVQADVAPKLSDDIDLDDDGKIDAGNPALRWDVLDSISLHHGTFTGPVAYGQIVFIDDNFTAPTPVITPVDAVVVRGTGFGYAARIGDSIGHTADDWVAGTVRDRKPTDATVPVFRFEDGIFGVPTPRFFEGRELDHLGESNFAAGVRGKFTEDRIDALGVSVTVPISGVSVLADTNGNGVRDIITYRVDPNNYPLDTDLTNRVPGVTLTTVVSDGSPTGFAPIVKLEDPFGTTNRIFSAGGVTFHNESRKLLIEFYRPARSVSIEVIAGSTFTPTYGRLEAFNSAGQSLGLIRTRPMFGETRQQIRLAFSDDVIAYALAYSDNTFLNSTPFGQLDNLTFTQSEALAVTDSKGEYELEYLEPDDYEIIAFPDTTSVFTETLLPKPITVTRYENFKFDFTVQKNSNPVIADAVFTIDENSAIDSLVGTVVATDRDVAQNITFSLQDAATSPLRIDPATGQLFVRDPLLIDFEKNPLLEIPVIATDSVGGITAKKLTVNLRDLNEAPSVTIDRYFISEEADQGSAIGRVNAFDPELPGVSPNFVITGGSGANVFSIEGSTGVLRVTNPDLLDFEVQPLLTLVVAISDSSTPPQVRTVTIDIALTNANDPPVITSESFDAREGLLPGVSIGTVLFAESDVSQTHTFRLVDDNDGLFRIDTTTGVISLVGALDFETSATHEIIVQVVDSGTPPQGNSKAITIRVANEDEPATLNNVSYSIQENSVAGSFIGSLIAIDPEGVVGFRFASLDISNPTLLFGGRVRLNQLTGGLTVAENAVLDAESATQILSDRVRILDGTANAGEALLTLVILNVNEAPVIAPQQRYGLPLGLPSGRVFGEVVVSDPEKNAITLEVIGAAATQFGIDVNKRLFVLPGVTIDFASDPEIEVQVRATDSTSLASTGTITVTSAPRPRFGTAIPDRSFNSGAAIDFSLPVQYRAETVRSISVTGPDGKLPEGLTFDPVIARISGIAVPSSDGSFVLTVKVSVVDGDAVILKEEKFNFTITRPNVPLLNTVNSFDVDGNGRVEPLDALRIINFLARKLGSDVQALADLSKFFYDTNGSNSITAADALSVINQIARLSRSNAGSGESTSTFAVELNSKSKRADAALEGYLAEPRLF